MYSHMYNANSVFAKFHIARVVFQIIPHCTNHVVQTNLPNIAKTHIFRTAMKSTFARAMPYAI